MCFSFCSAPPRNVKMPTLYIDLMSQPCRAVYILCKMYSLPVDVQMIRLDKGQHKQEEYLSINPLGKVPFLADGDVHIPESAAIMAYLAELYQLPEQWHPHTPASSTGREREGALRKRAVFDAATHWQHLTIRRGCMTYAFATVIGPRVFNVPASPAVAQHGLQITRQALKDLESYWLAGGSRPFMTGDSVSVADVLCVCELEQLHMLVAEPSSPQLDQLLQPHPIISNWMQRVRHSVGTAVYDDAHSKLRAAVHRLGAAGGKATGRGQPSKL